MKILLFGATGMVGQGVLRECLLAPDVELVQTIGRTATNVQHPKLRALVHADLWNYQALEPDLAGMDACFFCLGVSSGGMTEPAYRRITYDIAMAAAETLARLNPGMTFIYVSGAGADSSEKGRVMWARIKGETENALRRLPLKAYAFRPGVIEPTHGERSKTTAYRIVYAVAKPILPLLRSAFPDYILPTGQIGRAMLAAARHGAPKQVLESRDIRALASTP